MKLIGNILWFLFGGLETGLSWCISGLFWCITLIGIPIGIQCFKIARLSFFPFGQLIKSEGGTISFVANIFWFFFFGIPLALENFFFGIIWSITIIGIPFGMQFFKLAKLSLAPFGKTII